MEMNIHNADCLDVLRTLPDNSIDLVVTSPPYDNLRTYSGYIDAWSFEKFKGVANELYRLSKDGGVVVWVVNDATIDGSETGTSFRQALHFMEIGFRLHDTMIYAKHNPVPVGGKNRYYQAFEYMFVFSKGTPKSFNPLSEPRRNVCNDKRVVRYKSFNRDSNGQFHKKEVAINQEDPKRRNVWTYMVGGGNTSSFGMKHPAMFPEQLAKDHILSWSDEGDTVLDPFMGSGTTGVECIECNRNFIGIEINEDYFEDAKKRLEDCKRNLKEVFE